jgi:hypothetical protein
MKKIMKNSREISREIREKDYTKMNKRATSWKHQHHKGEMKTKSS